MSSKAISFMDPDVQLCPFEAYSKVRDQGSVYVDPQTGWFVVTDYDLVKKLSADTDNLSSFTGMLMAKRKSSVQEQLDEIYRKEGFEPVPVLVVSDPPEHKFYRAFVEKAFTPARLKKMEDYLASVVDEMIGSVLDQPEVEFNKEIAVKVPLTIIADQLGLDRSDMPRLKYWTDSVMENQDQSISDERQIELAKIICELHRYTEEKVEQYRKAPRECLLSDLANGVVDDRRLTMQEIAALVEQLLTGGNDTSTSAMTSAMLRLTAQPELQDSLRNAPEQIPKFIEEVLRLDAPVQGLFREAKQNIDIGGVEVPRGSVVVLKWGAGNRDPSQFENPNDMDINRPNLKRHMTFGFGPHTCVGNQLVRAEMRILFTRLLEKMRNVRLSRGDDSVKREPHFFFYGPRELYITFDTI